MLPAPSGPLSASVRRWRRVPVAECGSGRPALLAIRIHIERCYFHCARSVIRSHLWEPEHWPEAKRISFGKIFAARNGGDEDQATKIDAFVEKGYTTNLWSNG